MQVAIPILCFSHSQASSLPPPPPLPLFCKRKEDDAEEEVRILFHQHQLTFTACLKGEGPFIEHVFLGTLTNFVSSCEIIFLRTLFKLAPPIPVVASDSQVTQKLITETTLHPYVSEYVLEIL